MRRRLERLIPIVLLVVLVQLLAPVAAFRAMASTASDPLSMAPICSGMTSSADQQAPSNAPHAHVDCCVFCAGHAGGLLVDPPAPVFAGLQLLYQKIVWLEAADRMPAVRVGSNAQARAPPSLS